MSTQERNAVYIVESVKDLEDALLDKYVGEYMDDDYDSPNTFIVLREDDYAVLWICKNTMAHEILIELQYTPDELEFLYDTMTRLSNGNDWTFYDSSIWCNMPYEKYGKYQRMSWKELGNTTWVNLLEEWDAQFYLYIDGVHEITCGAWNDGSNFYYREIDAMTGQILYMYSVTANEYTVEKFLNELTARAETDEWMLTH